jgi:3-oxoadipate enol-lactonase
MLTSQRCRNGSRQARSATAVGDRRLTEAAECQPLYETVKTRPDILDRVRKALFARDPAVHAAMWEMIAGLDLTDRLHEIVRPTQILVGELDPSCPPAAARAMYDQIAGSRMTVLPDTSHMTILERPQLISEQLASFLEPSSH